MSIQNKIKFIKSKLYSINASMELYNAQNLKNPNRFTLQEYYSILDEVSTLFLSVESDSELRDILFKDSDISSLINNLVNQQRLSPGFNIHVATRDHLEQITCGYGSDDGRQALNENSIYDLNKISQVFLHVCFYYLEDQGYVYLDTPLEEVFKNLSLDLEFERLADITIEDILERRVTLHTSIDCKMTANYNTLMKILKNSHASTLPAESKNNDISAMVLKVILESIVHEDYDDFVNEIIFKRLKMQDTSFFVPMEKRDRLIRNNGTVSDSLLKIDRRSHLAKHEGHVIGHDSIYSTPKDMINFGKSLELIIPRESIDRLRFAAFPKENSMEYEETQFSSLINMNKKVLPRKEFKYLSSKTFSYSDHLGSEFRVDPDNDIVMFAGGNRCLDRAFPVSLNNCTGTGQILEFEGRPCTNEYFHKKEFIMDEASRLAILHNFLEEMSTEYKQTQKVRTI